MTITPIEAYSLMFRDYPDVVSVKDVSLMLNLSPKKVYELIHTGKLDIIPCGRVFRIAKLSVFEFLVKNISAA